MLLFSRNALISVVVIVVLGLLFNWATQRTITKISLNADDWQALRFSTKVHDEFQSSVVNKHGGGQLRGYGQYFSTRVVQLESTGNKGVMQFAVDDAYITIIDVSSLMPIISFDRTENLYGLSVYSLPFLENNQPLYEFPSPSTGVPKSIQPHVVYKSEATESLRLTFPETGNPYTQVSLLAPAATSFEWNFRQDCLLEFTRYLDAFSRSKNRVSLQESCNSDRNHVLPHVTQSESETVFQTWAGSFIFISPAGYNITTDNFGTPLDSGASRYLILVENPGSLAHVVASVPPERTYLSMSMSTAFDDSPSATPLTMRPFSNMIEFDGPIGNIAVGLRELETSRLTDVTIEFSDLPTVTVENSIIEPTVGTPEQIQTLQTSALAKSVLFNAVELVENQWQQIPAEIQGALIGTTIGILISAVAQRFSRPKKRRATRYVFARQPFQHTVNKSGWLSVLWLGIMAILMAFAFWHHKD